MPDNVPKFIISLRTTNNNILSIKLYYLSILCEENLSIQYFAGIKKKRISLKALRVDSTVNYLRSKV